MISSTTRGFQSLKHVTIAARHSTNPSNFVNQVDLCRTAARVCIDFHIDPTNIRFSGVKGFNMPPVHIPILEDEEEVAMLQCYYCHFCYKLYFLFLLSSSPRPLSLALICIVVLVAKDA